MRFVRTLITLGFLLFGVAVVLVAVGAHLTTTGRSVPVMRTSANRLGEWTAGQSILQMAVSLSVDPAERRLDGVARLRVQSTEDGRDRLYLLLNDGLAVREVWQESEGGERTVLSHQTIWAATVVELPSPMGEGDETTVGIAYSGDPFSGVWPLGQRVLEADEIILTPRDLWYPTDLKSFFRADVEVTLPESLTVAHSGSAEVVTDLGSSRRTRWALSRPAAGVALIAGRFEVSQRQDNGVTYRSFISSGIDLAAERILDEAVFAFAEIGAAYGASGSSRQSLVVSRRVARPFADGTGVIGLSPAQFTAGDYGFAAIAEGVARTWWGGIVASQPTDPEAGGAWVIDGFAANAARGAVRRRFGADADFRWRRSRMFDPTLAGVLGEVSLLEDELDPAAIHSLRGKAAYVAMMLQERVGVDAYHQAARQFLDRYRYQTVTSQQLAAVFDEHTGAALEPFFEGWLHSVGQVDLSLDPRDGGAVLANQQTNAIDHEVELWRIPPGGQPVEQSMTIGAKTPIGNVERLVIDPRATLADMYRSNNVLPREAGPRAIARSARGSWMVVEGEPHDWAPARIREIDVKGQTQYSWEFDRGLVGTPRWSADGTRILAVEPPSGGQSTLYALYSTDGTQSALGHDVDVAGGVDGILAARRDRLVFVADGEMRDVLRVDDGVVMEPRLAADGRLAVVAVQNDSQVELRLVEVEGGASRVLMTWPSVPTFWEWSPDSDRVFAILAGDWDWQLWEIPVDSVPRILMREAAGARALAVSPDGAQVAVAAQAALDYRFERHEVFVIDRAEPSAADHFTVSGQNVVDLSWRDESSLFVIAADPTHSMVPERRDIRILRLTDGSVLDFR